MVLSTVLGGGMSSRLFTEVRERRGLAYYVFATNHAYTDAGSLYAQAGVDIERIDDAVETVAAELRKIAAEAVPEDELRKAKSFAKGRFVAPDREPARADHVRPPPRGARGPAPRSRRRCSPASRRSPPRTSSASRRN